MKTYKEFSEQAYSSKSQIDEGLGTALRMARKPIQRLAKGAVSWFNKGKNTRIPNEAQAPFGSPLEYFKKNPNPKTLFGDDALQRGMSNQAYKAGEKPGLLGRPDRAFGVDIPQSIQAKKDCRSSCKSRWSWIRSNSNHKRDCEETNKSS